MENFLLTGGSACLSVLIFELCLAFLLTGLPYVGKGGKSLSTYLCHAPGLDVMVSLMIWVPWVVVGMSVGWAGVLGCLVGQMVAMQLWIIGHEMLNARYRQGPRINAYINQRYGWWRNQLALWVTALAIPVFFAIRFAEIFVYPWLTWILDFKAYNHRDWVNVSRQKFEGLIGTDLIWCLYCDWMTGVYSLGAEMLRNVESFWCPIRFYYDKKCENCNIDFPDVNGGWVAADGSLEEVVETLQTHMNDRPVWSWFNDPDRAHHSPQESSEES